MITAIHSFKNYVKSGEFYYKQKLLCVHVSARAHRSEDLLRLRNIMGITDALMLTDSENGDHHYEEQLLLLRDLKACSSGEAYCTVLV